MKEYNLTYQNTRAVCKRVNKNFSSIGNLEKKTVQRMGAGFVGLLMLGNLEGCVTTSSNVNTTTEPLMPVVEKASLDYRYRALLAALTFREVDGDVFISEGINKEGKEYAQAKVKVKGKYLWISFGKKSIPSKMGYDTTCILEERSLLKEERKVFSVEEYIQTLPRKNKQ